MIKHSQIKYTRNPTVGSIERMANDTIKLIIECPFCAKEQVLIVSTDNYHQWIQGMLVQKAFPMLSPSEREMLITGMCDDCFPTL
jgi:hypothetical protein